jgi:hypothetical protein
MGAYSAMKGILYIVISGAIGFAAGIGLLLDTPRRSLWLFLNQPGFRVASLVPFAHPGMTVWVIPIVNSLAYAVAVALLVCLTVLLKFHLSVHSQPHLSRTR